MYHTNPMLGRYFPSWVVVRSPLLGRVHAVDVVPLLRLLSRFLTRPTALPRLLLGFWSRIPTKRTCAHGCHSTGSEWLR